MSIWSENLWYAVQETQNGDWDKGSYAYEEAKEMLKEQGFGLIATINDKTNVCLDEQFYEDIF